MSDETKLRRRKIGKRSPSYPLLSLTDALDKLRMLWDADKNNPIPLEAAYSHLGYKSTGGYAARVFAALKKFDLIYEKQNDIILTEDAVDLMLHSSFDPHYIETIKKLALKPAIYDKLYNEYKGNLPSDATLKIKLIKDYEFNPESVDDFIENFRETIDFANFFEKPKTDNEEFMSSDVSDKEQDSSKKDVIMQPGMQSYPIPLSKMKKAIISFETLPVNKKDIKAIKDWLNLFSSSLTGTEESESDSKNDKEEPSKE